MSLDIVGARKQNPRQHKEHMQMGFVCAHKNIAMREIPTR